jgi:uncharacterized protein
MNDPLLYIVKQLVDDPEQVKVTQVDGDETTIYELSVAKPDMGKVIGKNGRTISAIRLLTSAISNKNHRHSVIELLEGA